MLSPQERIAEAFNDRFGNFGIRIEAGDVRIGGRREIKSQGWRIALRVVADDAGLPYLEFYATHRMTGDGHARIWADGRLEEMDAIWESYAFDAKVPGSEEAARERFLRHNQVVADRLRAVGLYPEGDVNAYLRTGGDMVDTPDGSSTDDSGHD